MTNARGMVTATTVEMVQQALDTIVANENAPALNWAVNYAKHARAMLARNHGVEPSELKTQLLYVVGNMTHWRHPLAKETRATLNNWIKEN